MTDEQEFKLYQSLIRWIGVVFVTLIICCSVYWNIDRVAPVHTWTTTVAK